MITIEENESLINCYSCISSATEINCINTDTFRLKNNITESCI